jgi:hypothetical protein
MLCRSHYRTNPWLLAFEGLWSLELFFWSDMKDLRRFSSSGDELYKYCVDGNRSLWRLARSGRRWES